MKKKYVILLHVCFWVLYIGGNSYAKFSAGSLFTSANSSLAAQPYTKYLLIEIGYAIVAMSCFYGSYLGIAPQIFVRKRYWLALICSLICVAFTTGLRYLLEYKYFMPVLGFDNYRGHPWPASRYISNVFFYYFPTYFMYGMICFFAENWYKNSRRHQDLQKEKLTTELAFLRSQVNPHFLFNTINDIYSLTYQKSEQAPEALLKLSAMLRYMLREGTDNLMPLNREAEYLENMITLQRIGAKGSACINFVQEGLIADQPVASLLFIAFVENAFKHGVMNDPDYPIDIYLHADNKGVIFNVRNKKNNGFKDNAGGIGLNNVRRRLALIYPDKHQLMIKDNGEMYEVNLFIKSA